MPISLHLLSSTFAKKMFEKIHPLDHMNWHTNHQKSNRTLPLTTWYPMILLEVLDVPLAPGVPQSPLTLWDPPNFLLGPLGPPSLSSWPPGTS